MDKSLLKSAAKGGITQNPTFVLVIGICPLIAISTSLINSLYLGAATALVLLFSNGIISLLRNVIPSDIRLPAYIIIIAALVSVVDLFMHKYMSDFYAAVRPFVALIAVNCIVMARAEVFASKNGVLYSLIDGLSMGCGFLGAICLLGGVRQLLGGVLKMQIFLAPAGGFLVFGLLLAAFNYIIERASNPKKRQKA